MCAKACFTKKFGFAQAKSIDAIIGQFGEKYDSWNPRKAGCRTGR